MDRRCANFLTGLSATGSRPGAHESRSTHFHCKRSEAISIREDTEIAAPLLATTYPAATIPDTGDPALSRHHLGRQFRLGHRAVDLGKRASPGFDADEPNRGGADEIPEAEEIHRRHQRVQR